MKLIIKRIQQKNNNFGFTLLEILLVAFFLLFMVGALIAFMMHTLYKTNRILGSIIIQPDIRQSSIDILRNLNSTTWGRFVCEGIGPQGIYYFGDDPRRPLLIQSALNDDGKLNADSGMVPNLKSYTLYFIIRPPGDICLPAINYGDASSAGIHDLWCPHKLLIKKKIKPVAFCLGSAVTLPMLEAYMSPNLNDDVFGNILEQESKAKNVIDFEVIPPADGLRFTIYYNGAQKRVVNKILSWRLAGFKDKKYLDRKFNNVNLLAPDEIKNIFYLDGKADPRN